MQAPLRGRFLFHAARVVDYTLVGSSVYFLLMTIPTRYGQLVIEGAKAWLRGFGAPFQLFLPFLIGTLSGLIFVSYVVVGVLILAQVGGIELVVFLALNTASAVFAMVKSIRSAFVCEFQTCVCGYSGHRPGGAHNHGLCLYFSDGHFEPLWAGGGWSSVARCCDYY